MQEEENNLSKINENTPGVVLRDFFSECLKKWLWFIVTILICTSVAIIFAKSRTQSFCADALILIKSEDDGRTSQETAIFSDLGIGNPGNTVENEIYIIKSTPLMEQVVAQLEINVQYSIKKFLRYVNIYKDSPIEISPTSEISKKGYSIIVKPIDGNTFQFKTLGKFGTDWKTSQFGNNIKTHYGNFTVNKTPKFDANSLDVEIHTSIQNIEQQAISLEKKLDVQKADKETSIVKIEMVGSNYNMCRDIVNLIIAAYNEDVKEDKNQVAKATEVFIVNRISSISKDLGGIDTHIEKLKVNTNIPDLQSAATQFIADGSKYSDNLAQIEIQMSLVKYIKEYMSNMKEHELIPENTGVADIGIAKQIEAYNQECLKYFKLTTTSSKENPLTIDMSNGLVAMRKNIMHSIDNCYSSMKIKYAQAKGQEDIVKGRLASVPTQEKEISDVLRQQKIKEQLYLYLLNKREENALQLAITKPNAKIVEKGGGDDNPIAPSTLNITLIGLLIGLLLPSGIIYIKLWIKSLDSKVHTRRDIETATEIPIIGNIPRKTQEQKNQEIIVTENGIDNVTEAFRIIRSNMEYILNDKSQKQGSGTVIQFTSTIPCEGKSYTAINLALTFALLGKKAIAIDLDLHKGNFTKYVGSSHSKQGVTAYLAGKTDDIDSIIQKGFIANTLDIVSLGTIPPNPSQLLMSDRFKTMLDTLRQKYDYIFLDTVPYGVLADAQIINRHVDMTIYVMRSGCVDKQFIFDLDKMYKEDKIKNVSILLTDIKVGKNSYGYGYGYGYGYSYGYKSGKKKPKWKIW